ncbi:MAG: hypothetical protein HYT65_03065 [Candidatus Yanofskybacteria bacterium]|nr:hypothetical protein [Candidatus Yanofskybacteria bacterium]
MSIILITFIALVPYLGAQEIMPLNQVKPGDRGYGLTVFSGEEPERFDFEVLDTLDYGITKYIVVVLSGGPTDENGVEIIKNGNVFGGMSGSPLYIDDKIIGAIAITGQFLKKPQALVTPIELMVNFKTVAFDFLNQYLDGSPDVGSSEYGFTAPDNIQQLKAGDSYMACEVWDDNSDLCSGPGGTVTMVNPENPKIFYSLGHSGLGQNGIVRVPFWKAEVVTMMPSIALSQKMLKKTGPMLGAVIFNGPFGQIARFGAMPPYIPFTIKIENNFKGTLERKHLFAYTPNLGMNISRVLSGMKRLIDDAFDADAEIRMDISDLPQIYFRGTSEELSAVGSMANIFSDYAVIPNIKNITATLKARAKYEVMELKKAEIENVAENNGKLDLKITLLAGNGKFFTNNLSITVDKKYLDKTLRIANGREVASRILSSLGPSENTVTLLNSIADRNSLYLYFTDTEDVPKPPEPITLIISTDSGSKSNIGPPLMEKTALAPELAPEKEKDDNLAGGWKIQHPKTPIIEILSKISFPNNNYLISGGKDIVLTLTPPDAESQPQQKRKRKFWVF